jgi:hypothetical protein
MVECQTVSRTVTVIDINVTGTVTVIDIDITSGTQHSTA